MSRSKEALSSCRDAAGTVWHPVGWDDLAAAGVLPDGTAMWLQVSWHAGEARWNAAFATGYRDISFAFGAFPVACEALPEALPGVFAGAAAAARDSGIDWRAQSWGGGRFPWLDWRGFLVKASSDPAFAAFPRIAGHAAAVACSVPMGGVVSILDALDPDGGRGIDRVCATWPFLLVPMVDLSQEGAIGAVARLTEAAAFGERRLAEAMATTDFPLRLRRLMGRQGEFRDGWYPPLPPCEPATKLAACRALLRRWRGLHVEGYAFRDVLAAACAVPADWIPADRPTAEDFVHTAMDAVQMVRDSDGALDLRIVLSAVGGRWREVHQTILGRRHKPLDVVDMAEAFAMEYVLPAALHLGLVVPEEAETLARRAAWRLLFGGKAMLAVLEASSRWHAGVGRSSRTLTLQTWAAPFGAIALPSGGTLTALVDSVSLAAEGETLAHCVGGYAPHCISRRSVIASVRRGGVATSTAELSGWSAGARWLPFVRQHRGRANDKPPEADARDLAALLAAWTKEGGLAVGEADGAGETFEERVLSWCGFDWRDGQALARAFAPWAGYLKKDDRASPLQAVARCMAETSSGR